MSMVFNALDHQAAFAEVLGLLPEQKGAYLDGLLAGAMGADPERLPDGPARLGAIRGQEGRNRYEARVQKQRDAGKASAAKRAKEGRPHFPNDVRNGAPNDAPSDVPRDDGNDVPNTVPSDVANDAPNDDRTPIEQEKRREEIPPPNPPGGDGEEVELGETEKRVASAWDSIAVPAGFAPSGPWSKRRRRALRALITELGATPDQFVQSWARAVQSMAKDAWSRDQGVNIDGLLAPALFRRRLDAWRPSREESRTPPPRYPSVPAETTRANHAALMNGLFPPRRTDAAIEADPALSAA